MDPLRLLSRSTRLTKGKAAQQSRHCPSAGQQTFPPQPSVEPTVKPTTAYSSRKRKRETGLTVPDQSGLDFFGTAPNTDLLGDVEDAVVAKPFAEGESVSNDQRNSIGNGPNALDTSREVLKKNRLKIFWLNPPTEAKEKRKKKLQSTHVKPRKAQKIALSPQPMEDFVELRSRFQLPATLIRNVEDEGYAKPTAVQMGAVPLLLERTPGVTTRAEADIDLLTVAPTGSGKTVAFLVPLIHQLMQRRACGQGQKPSASAIILAPTKELVSQIVNEGRKLARNTGIKISLASKSDLTAGNPRADTNEHADFVSTVNSIFRTRSDIFVSTPGLLASISKSSTVEQRNPFPGTQYLVLDEADVLLDPLFREQTLAIWESLTHKHLRVSLWSATMGSNIEELARSVIARRTDTMRSTGIHIDTEVPLVRLVVGLKDAAVPSVEHRLVYAANEQGKLMGLRQLLRPGAAGTTAEAPMLPPLLVFTQTIDRATALHSELLYDIPAEAGGISRIAVLHSSLSDAARDNIMSKFRKGEVWVLITTDLLSRGVDFRGVNGVVNYDMPTSSAAYVHRVGRTGRAGREGGIAVTLYTKEDIPYLKQIANVVAMSQKQRGETATGGIQQWLLDVLPSLGKNAKLDLKKRGIESRTARGMEKDPRAARRARISTKSGFGRREENRRKGAVAGSRRRLESVPDDGDETDFGGFD